MPRRWLPVTALLGAAGCSNLLAHKLLTGSGSVRDGLAKRDAYVLETGGETLDYPTAVGLELGGLAGVLAGAVGRGRSDSVTLSQPDVVLWAVLAPIAVWLAARRGIWLPALVSVPFLLLLPLFNSKFDLPLNGRYLMPLIPLILISVAAMAVAVWRRAMVGGAWQRLAALTALALLLIPQIVSLVRYERAALADGGNVPYMELSERIRRERHMDEHVLLDADLGGTRIASARQGVSVVEYLLVVSRDPVPVTSGRASDLSAWIGRMPNDYLLVLLPDARRIVGARHQLVPVGAPPSGREQRLSNVGLYRVERGG